MCLACIDFLAKTRKVIVANSCKLANINHLADQSASQPHTLMFEKVNYDTRVNISRRTVKSLIRARALADVLAVSVLAHVRACLEVWVVHVCACRS